MLFKATPVAKPRAQVTNIIQINGSLLLDPPAPQRRVAFAAEPIRAEPTGSRRLSDGRRELDARTVAVTPTKRPGPRRAPRTSSPIMPS